MCGMRRKDATMRQAGRMRGWTCGWMLVLGLLVSLPALAQRTEGERATASGPYAAEVPVRNQTDTSGFGLLQVCGRNRVPSPATGKIMSTMHPIGHTIAHASWLRARCRFDGGSLTGNETGARRRPYDAGTPSGIRTRDLHLERVTS